MKIIYILFKEIKECLRDIRSLIIMLFMPLLLTTILSITFKDSLSNNINFSDLRIFYTVNTDINETEVVNEFINILNKLGIKTINADSISKDNINLEFASLSNIKISYPNKLKSQSKIIYSLLDVFLDRYNVIQQILPRETLSQESIESLQQYNYVIENSLDNIKKPSSKDYYGIVMITLSLMFSSIIGAYKIISERNSGTLTKLLSTPTSKITILLGKLLGTSLFIFIEAIIILFISDKFLNVYMGYKLYPILITLFSEITFALSLGILIGYFIKDNRSAWLCLLIVIMVFGFLGGAFLPLSTLNNDIIYKLSAISPLNYVNTSIFNCIYNYNKSMCFNVSILNFLISTILLLITNLVMEVRQ